MFGHLIAQMDDLDMVAVFEINPVEMIEVTHLTSLHISHQYQFK